jgi:hypothetical protein
MFGKSWLTSVLGLIGGAAQILIPYITTGVVTAEQITTALGLIALGGAAKSFNVTGGPK